MCQNTRQQTAALLFSSFSYGSIGFGCCKDLSKSSALYLNVPHSASRVGPTLSPQVTHHAPPSPPTPTPPTVIGLDRKPPGT